MKNTYSRIEAVKWLLDNPKGRLKQVIGFDGYEYSSLYEINKNGHIENITQGGNMPFFLNDRAEFELIPPKKELRMMDFWEAFKIIDSSIPIDYSDGKCFYGGIMFTIDDVLSSHIQYSTKLKLLKEKWTVEGIFED